MPADAYEVITPPLCLASGHTHSSRLGGHSHWQSDACYMQATVVINSMHRSSQATPVALISQGVAFNREAPRKTLALINQQQTK